MEAPPPSKEEEVETSDWSPTLAEHRLRLRPWLESMLDSRQIRDLEWIDHKKSFFKIPWKHRSKKDWDMEHIKVFMEWAKHTGKYREGDKPDYVAMKTRLRCAFNKAPDIIEVKHLHRLKCSSPYKVYSFIQKPDVAKWQEDVNKTPPSSSNVCTVPPTVVQRSDEEDSGTDLSESDTEDDDLKPGIDGFEVEQSVSLTRHSPGKKSRKRRKDNICEVWTKAKETTQADAPLHNGVDNPSTLAAARMLLSLNNSGNITTIAVASHAGMNHEDSQNAPIQNASAMPTGLIPRLLMAPPRLPVSNKIIPCNNNPFAPQVVGPLGVPMFQPLMMPTQQIDIDKLLNQPKQLAIPELLTKPESNKMATNTSMLNSVHHAKPPDSVVKSDQHNDLGGEQTSTFFGKAQLQSADSNIRLMNVTQTFNPGTHSQMGKLGFTVNPGASSQVSNFQYQLMNVPPADNTSTIATLPTQHREEMTATNESNIAIMNVLQKIQANKTIQPQPLTSATNDNITNGIGHLEIVELQNNGKRMETNKRMASLKYARTINLKECKQETHKSWSRRGRNVTAGVTFSNHGNIMTPNVVNSIKQAIVRKGHGLAEETLRMREAYGVTLQRGLAVQSLKSSHENQDDKSNKSDDNSGDGPPQLLPISSDTIKLYQRAHKVEMTNMDMRLLEQEEVILDLRVLPDGVASSRENMHILDLSVKRENNGRLFKSAPACFTEEGALDLTLKRKSEGEHMPPNKHLLLSKRGASLAVHAIWDLSKAKGIQEEETDLPQKSPSTAVDLSHSQLDTTIVKASPESKESTSEDELSDHNYYSTAPLPPNNTTQGIVVIETDYISEAYKLGAPKQQLETNVDASEKQPNSVPSTVEEEDDVIHKSKKKFNQINEFIDDDGDDDDDDDEEEEEEEEEDEGEDEDTKLAAKQLMELAKGVTMKVKSLPCEDIIKAVNRKLTTTSASAKSAKKEAACSGNNWGSDSYKKGTLALTVMSNFTSRQRLRPWLESKISSGDIKGLEWLDKEPGKFKIPWKHGGKHDWTPDNSRIFMEWAKHTGRYREGIDDEDYATWKTRLRCAFNKAPDIQEVKEETNLNCSEPFRVYRLIPKDELQRFLTPATTLSDDEEPAFVATGKSPLPLVLKEYCSTDPSATYPSDLRSIPSTDLYKLSKREIVQKGHPQVVEQDSAYSLVPQTSTPTFQTTTAPTFTSYSQAITSDQYDTVISLPSLPSLDSRQMSDATWEQLTGADTQTTSSEVSNAISEARTVVESQTIYQAEATGMMTQLKYPDQFDNAGMRVQLKYQNQCIQEYIITEQKGCRIASEKQPKDANQEDIEEIIYPGISKPTSQEQHQIASLLSYIKPGVMFECQDGDIYATRSCQCGVYFISATGTEGKPAKLKRNEQKVKIFDFQKFSAINSLSLDPSVHLVFGQTCTLEELDEKMLITMTITSLKAEEYQLPAEEMDAEQSPPAVEFNIPDMTEPGDIRQEDVPIPAVITEVTTSQNPGLAAVEMVESETITSSIMDM